MLAIIALIATPIVMNVIENSRKGAAERSAENYLDAVETAIATERLDGKILDGDYTIQSDGNLCKTEPCTSDTDIDINMSGNKPSDGTINISNGTVSTSSTMTVGDYTVSYDSTKETYVASKEEAGNTTKVVYRWSTDTISIGAEIDPTNTTIFKTNPAELEKNYYLKHVLDNDNKVKESYSCAVLNGNEACVRGGVDENGNLFYNQNKSFLESLQSENITCSSNSSSTSCNDGSVYLFAYSDGSVDADIGAIYCLVNADGSSKCGTW